MLLSLDLDKHLSRSNLACRPSSILLKAYGRFVKDVYCNDEEDQDIKVI